MEAVGLPGFLLLSCDLPNQLLGAVSPLPTPGCKTIAMKSSLAELGMECLGPDHVWTW